MDILQQLNQQELGLESTLNPVHRDFSSEVFIASRLSESPTGEVRLMESILERKNMKRALKRVVQNKGAPGVDGMTVRQLQRYLKRHLPKIRQALLDGTYAPLPVRRKEIEKPDGGVRLLGIPSALDRLVQQAVAQVLTAIWDHTFSDSSFGFRPGRSQAQALHRCQDYLTQGYRYVVDLDLAKFFDTVPQDRLMSRLATRVKDKRVLGLIRRFLRSGVMIGGLVSPTPEGTPQGGPLSPLLSNIVLDELDKELEKRGLHFVRYADDCVIYVGSKRAGERVMESVTRFVTSKLKLQVNHLKSAVGRPWDRKYLGCCFTNSRTAPKLRLHWKNRRTRVGELLKRGVYRQHALTTGCARLVPGRPEDLAARVARPRQHGATSGPLPVLIARRVTSGGLDLEGPLSAVWALLCHFIDCQRIEISNTPPWSVRVPADTSRTASGYGKQVERATGTPGGARLAVPVKVRFWFISSSHRHWMQRQIKGVPSPRKATSDQTGTAWEGGSGDIAKTPNRG